MNKVLGIKNVAKHHRTKFLFYTMLIGILVGGVIAIYYALDMNIPARNQATVKEFLIDGHTAYVVFHFKSTSGAFTIGQPVHVDALLYYPTKTNPYELFSLLLPNAIQPSEYTALNDDSLWRSYNSGSLLVIPSDILEPSHNFTGTPLMTQFEIVWTQEGTKDAEILVSDSKNSTNSHHLLLSDVIDIEPIEVLDNIKTNNVIVALTIAIVILSIVTLISNSDRFNIKKQVSEHHHSQI